MLELTIAGPSGEFRIITPLPPGEYVCRLTDGESCISRNGHPEYKMTFRVLEGDFAGRRLWKSFYFSDDATPRAKRGLKGLGPIP